MNTVTTMNRAPKAKSQAFGNTPVNQLFAALTTMAPKCGTPQRSAPAEGRPDHCFNGIGLAKILMD